MEYKLNIAGYIITLESPELTIVPGKRFRKFQDPSAPLKGGSSVTIHVHSGLVELPPGTKCLFNAPFIEETNGIRIEKDPEFWSIWKKGKYLFIKTAFPLSPGNKQGLLKFSLVTNAWDLWIDTAGEESIDPLEYPLDGLVLYYLSVLNGDLMIHASGINHNGKGFIFSGVSGKGKTTMSSLWKNAGATVIHDDRLILRRSTRGFRMYNTPVYDDETPSGSDINSVYIIEHGKENTTARLRGASAISAVMSNCIQHNWGPETISALLQSVTDLCSEVPVYMLSFKPDQSVVDIISHG